MVPYSSDELNVREPDTHRRAEAVLMDPRLNSGMDSAIDSMDSRVRAVLALPALALADLPEPIALHLRVAGAPGSVLFTTQRIPCSDPRSASSTASTGSASPTGIGALNTTSTQHSHATHHAHAARAIIAFDRDELRALVLGVEADRIWHREFLGFCFEKWRAPTFRLSVEQALGGANRDCQAAWSSARFLRRLQAQLSAVEFVERTATSSAAAINSATATHNDACAANSSERNGELHHASKQPSPLLWAAA
jgi:hypothetical protein